MSSHQPQRCAPPSAAPDTPPCPRPTQAPSDSRSPSGPSGAPTLRGVCFSPGNLQDPVGSQWNVATPCVDQEAKGMVHLQLILHEGSLDPSTHPFGISRAVRPARLATWTESSTRSSAIPLRRLACLAGLSQGQGSPSSSLAVPQ